MTIQAAAASTSASTQPTRILVLHAPNERAHFDSFQRAFARQARARKFELVPACLPSFGLARTPILRHVLPRAEIVVFMLSPAYLAGNPDLAAQVASAASIHGHQGLFALVAEPVELDWNCTRALAAKLPSNGLPWQRRYEGPRMQRLAIELLDALAPAPIREVFCMFANSSDTDRLALQQEWRRIEEVNQKAGHTLTLDACWAARVHDFEDVLLERSPDILHFSGHGTRGGLVFETNEGYSEVVRVDRLVDSTARLAPRCLVFNACHSADWLNSARLHCPVIAMQGSCADRGSIEFSRAFYGALAHAWTIPDAFGHAAGMISLRDFEDCQPRLLQ